MKTNKTNRYKTGEDSFIGEAFQQVLVLLFALTTFGGVAHGEVFLETGFEGSSSLPAGWTQSTISGGATWAIQQGGQSGKPAAAHSGSSNAFLFASNTNENKTQLISPIFSTAGFINITLTFWHTQNVWYSDQDELKVFFSSDGGANWTQLAHYTSSVSAWTQRTLVLPTTSANSQIAFEGNAKWGYGVCLDDIEVSGIPDTWSMISVNSTDAAASEVGTDPGTWTITRTGNTAGALSVNYTLSGSATEGSDYHVDLSSPITFTAGETSKVVTLTPVDDTEGGEGDEVVTLTLTAGTGYAIGDGSDSISIYDDEGFELNILVIGSTHSFSEGGEHDVVHEKPFNPTAIADHLEAIIAQDTVLNKSVNVVFEDVYKSKTNTVRTSSTGIDDITAHCYSLAQHFMWPDGKTNRLANLRSEAGTQWDYIVLCSDPYIMANFPGMVAEGVKLIQSEVAKTLVPQGEQAPAVVLLAQWPENSSTFSADDFNKVVHRIGGSAGLTVVPAGKAWDSYTSQDTNAAHPTPKGEYLAAASIYSKLYNRSASTSGYDYALDGDAIADHALSEVRAIAAAPQPQYSGTYTDINPFQMKYVGKRTVSFRETGTSTEDRLAEALHRLDDVCRMRFIQNQGTFWDFNYGRGNDRWEDDKDYEVNPAKHDRAYGFPIHHYYTGTAANAAAQTMPYGIDKYYFGSTYEDGTDLGIAYNMIRPNTRELSLPADVRAIPIRLLWLKMVRAFPGFQPLGDNTHMSPYLNDASAAFMYTLLSGRCPVVDEPAPVGSAAWQQWLGHKTGYETAWQMSHLTTRAPGFRVLPSDGSTTAVTTQASETMTVRFAYPPHDNVTVNVTISNAGVASVSPSTLVFTPANYATPQEVTVTGKSIVPDSEEFEVVFATASNDEIYDSLGDSWTYTTLKTNTLTDLIAGFDGNNTSTTAGSTKTLSDPHQSTAALAIGVDATLSTTDAMSKDFQWTAANQASLGTWGTFILPPPPITSNNTAVATIAGPTTLQFTIDNSAGTQAIELETFHFSALRDPGAALQVTIAYASGDLNGTSGIQSLVNDTGTNHGYDFDLTAILSHNVLAAGQTATFTIAQTTSETARLKLDDIAISGNVLSAGPALSVSISPPSISENGGSATATVTRNSDTSNALAVTLVSDNASEATVASGDIPAGQTSADFAITAVDDGVLDGTQTVTITAFASGHSDGSDTLDVTDDEVPETLTVSISPGSISENGGTATATVSRNSDTTNALAVTLVSNDTGEATVASGEIAAGQASANFAITAVDDGLIDGTQTVTISASATGHVGGSDTLDVTDDDVPENYINISDLTQTPTTTAGPVSTNIQTLNGGAVVNPQSNGPPASLSYFVTTFTFGSESQAHIEAFFEATGGQDRMGVRVHDTGLVEVMNSNDPGRTTFSIGGGGGAGFMAGQSVTLIVRSYWNSTNDGLRSTLGTGDDMLVNVWVNPTGSATETAVAPGDTNMLNDGDLHSLWNSGNYGFLALEIENQGTPATGGQNSITNTKLFTGSDATFANALGLAIGTPNFANWISGYDLGAQTGFSDDPDKDGLANGIESYFGTHPGEFTAGMLASAVNASEGTFTFTHPVNGNPANDISAAYRWSKDLLNFYYSGQSEPLGTSVTFTPGMPSGGRLTVTANISGTSTDKILVDIEVNQN